MLGTIVNCAAIIAGGLIGTVFGSRIGERYTKTLMTVMALITAVIGLQSAIGTANILAVVVCMVAGTVIGIAIRLDDRLNSSGDKIKEKLSGTKLGHGKFSDAFVTSALVFAVGAMAILGSIQAGINHNYNILFTKSIIDFTSAIAFAAALGPGVILSALPILIVQGTLTLLAEVAQPFLTSEVVTEMSATGGVILFGMALNLLDVCKERIKVGDMIPAILLPIVYFPIVNLF